MEKKLNNKIGIYHLENELRIKFRERIGFFIRGRNGYSKIIKKSIRNLIEREFSLTEEIFLNNKLDNSNFIFYFGYHGMVNQISLSMYENEDKVIELLKIYLIELEL